MRDVSPHPDRWRILAITLCVTFMGLLDVTIVNIALPAIDADFGGSTSSLQWVVSGHALAFGLILVTGGRLGDALGRRRMMLIGLVCFVATSAACGLAPSIGWLIAARFAQGISAGLLVPQNSGIIQNVFSGPERGRAFGYMGMAVGISGSIGPVLGGVIIGLAGGDGGWRWIFLVNIPIGLALIAAVWRIIPGREPGSGKPDLDLVGAALLGLTVLALLFPISSVEHGFGPEFAIIALAPILGAFTVWWERRIIRLGRAPLLNIPLLRATPGYATGMAVGLLYFCGFTGVLLIYSIYLQSGLGFTPLHAGLLITPFAISSAVAAPIAGRLVARGGRMTTVAALVLLIVGLALAATLIPLTEDTALAIPTQIATMMIAGFGAGGVVGPNMTMTLANVPPRMGGAAGAAVQTAQRIGNAIGAAVLLLIHSQALTLTHDAGTGLRAVWVAAIVFFIAAIAVALSEGRPPSRREHANAPSEEERRVRRHT
ncbi:MFS transporter [Dietzia timorensis]|uniref:Putative actinorhodin transporter n=1 Tax=Dietzia timorensis TaxID=499555 RepID=A0A173LPQ5_9ACTN|nr:MFS transporter [Dietzia timorensis]ANI93648.1 putative actinorhodin transporter [Dietzia timorensis]